MTTPPLRRASALLVLFLLLSTPWAWASGGQAQSPPRQAAAAIAEVTRGVLGFLWGTLTNVWEESGCTIDPSGVNACSSGGSGAGLALESGCTIDPNGVTRCNRGGSLTNLAADNGCTIDPDGRCLPTK